ncbi:lipase, class 3 [Grosmannia clavigera kw1407]|uniref:Lipase, class 3 n=1 Tax=Grosmannia clavigera (strain kw1407 / UAMH 11150) TaxID=655863 RepID=F0XLC4_GROCL|nr:lipase, class 3 [Grosmannia clavigera kw1407]EFX01310.1 lipase, class 3 [Grosmannia clavigera kw1407]
MRSFSIIALCASLVGANPVLMRSDKTVVDNDTFKKMVYYLGFPRFTHYLATNTTCAPGNGGELIEYINVTSTDTQAALWKSTSTKEIVLGIPGTSGDRDVFTDLEIALVSYKSPNVDCTDDCKVHDGFQKAWNSIEPAVSASLAKALKANPGYTTIVSGHSLGAAIAALAFASLVNGPYNVTTAYTYGQPRTGNQAFANYLDSISGASDTEPGILYRVTHSNVEHGASKNPDKTGQVMQREDTAPVAELQRLSFTMWSGHS